MKQLESILLYLDSEIEPALLDRFVRVAKVVGARITLAGVVEPAASQVLFAKGSLDLDKVERLLVEDRLRKLNEAISKVDAQGVTVSARVFLGDPVDAIIRAVMTEEYDFLVKQPAPADGLRQQVLGSIDMRLLRACPCPVSISQLKKGEYTRHAVVAVDYPGENEIKAHLNEALLDFVAFGLGTEFSEVHVVHAWALYGESLLTHGRSKFPPDRLKQAVELEREKRQQWLESLVDEYRDTLDDEQAEHFHPTLELLHGDPTIVIPQRVKELDADLLALGTASRTGLSGWLMGNTAEGILGSIDRTVITLKPEGFVSPVSPA